VDSDNNPFDRLSLKQVYHDNARGGASYNSSGKFTHPVDHLGEELGQLAELPPCDMANERPRHPRSVRVQLLQEIEPFSRDLDFDDSPILLTPSPFHEAPGIEPVD
jgi:hypothetical protein